VVAIAQSTLQDVVMPRLSDSMEEGTILTWLKQVGEEVAVGEELVEIETDKANMAYESDLAGTLTEILAEEGETLPIGAPIARIGDSRAGARPTAGAGQPSASGVAGGDPGTNPSRDRPPVAPAAVAADGSAGGPAQRNGNGARPKASPLARRLAKDKQLDLAQLQGSGPAGRIVKADVERAVSSAGDAGTGDAAAAGAAAGTAGPETAKGEVSVQEPTKLQSVVARRMAESKATAPHFYLSAEVDMSRAMEARKAIKASAREGDVVPSFNDMVVKACAIALREHPKANGSYRDGRFELYSRVNVGVAVAAAGALVVPTVFDADRKGLRQIAEDTRALAQRVREQAITPPELSGATFTVSNLGMYGIADFGPVINSSQAAILAVGAIEQRPAVRGGEIVPAQLMSVTLACDHRILYGAEGAEFLARVRVLLEEPVGLAL
jgi:pyruvate dehydrogenase E2 component (dihydrolipoamide acetyltransferase)